MSEHTEDQVTLGDKAVETSQFDRYKGTLNRTDRIAIISTTLTRGYRYYMEAKRSSFRAPTNPETLKLVKASLGEPEQRFGLVVFHYLTDEAGNLIDTTKCQGKIKVWSISESRYEELSGLHRTWPLLDSAEGFAGKQVDLQIRCTEEKFQRMTFTPCPDAQWKKKEAWYNALKEKEAKARDKLKLTLGKQLTDHEILDLLGTALPSQTGGTQNAGEVDLSDVLDG